MAPFIPRTPKASHSIGVGTNLLTESEARQLVGAIVDTGRISAADAELVVEQLMIPANDPSPPLHAATFRHVSNGPLHASTVRT